MVLGLAVLFGLGSLCAESRVRPEPQYGSLGRPDQAEGRKVLEEVRLLGLTGDFALDFTLRAMPRLGAETTVAGRMYGTRNDQGPVTLVEFPANAPGTRRMLVQNGPQPAVWTVAADGADSVAVGAAQLFAPLAGTDLSAFDLQMPFLFWSDFVYEGVVRLRGRPAHQFLVFPPAAIAAVRPDLSGVRFYLDTQFNALVQAEQLGPDRRPARTMSVLDLKRTQDQWIVRTIDLRDETTRNKTRFHVEAAALNLRLPPVVFQPAHLPVASGVGDGLKLEAFQ